MVIAFIWPEPGILFKNYLVYLLMLMMTLSYLSLDFDKIKETRKDWWRILIMLIFIFPLPVLFTYLLCTAFSINSLTMVGMVLASAMPCGISVIFISDLLGGEPPKALISATLAHLISPILTPLLVWIAVHEIISVDFFSMLILIGKLVIIPFVIAKIIKYLKAEKPLIKVKNVINTYLLVLMSWAIIAPAKSLILSDIGASLFLALLVAIVLSILFLLSLWFGRTRKEKITWSIISLFKNFTLSSVIALSLFGPTALLGSIAYGLISNFSVIPLQYWNSKR